YGAVRELAEIFVISFNPTAPDSFYSISTIIVAAYAVKKGLEVIARVNQILLPFGIIVLFFIAAINISKIDLSNFLPILYNGIFPSIRGALLINAWITESVILLQILPYVRDKEKIRLYTNISVLVLGGSLLAGVLTISVLGVTVTERMLFPALQYIKIASIGPQITNLDLSIMVVWISGIFIKISTTYYAGVLSISQIFGLKTYKNMIIPFGLLIIAFSIYTYKNVSDLIHDLHYIFPFLMLLVAFVIPSILLAVSFIRKPPLGDEKQQADNVSNQNSARKDA
ncbi:MAG: GerAB/ArcD/ProY family transporter, partial [Caulobacteraceae bacterium]